MEKRKHQNFTQWFESNFSSPKAIIMEYFEELQNKAAEVGAALPPDFIQKLSITCNSEQRDYTYLPTFKGVNDTKQFAYAFMGDTNFKDCSVKVPIVIFCSFKLSVGYVTWAPSRRLIADFKRSKKVIPYVDTPDKSYKELLLKMEEDELKNAQQRDILKAKSNQAASELSAAQLRSGLIQAVVEPSYYFGINGLSFNKWSEFVCVRSVRDMLYVQSKKTWKECFVASPKDLIIPMYDINNGQLTNIQRIRPLANGKAEKRFLPGGRMLEQCAMVSEHLNTNTFIVTEGYKTARIIDEAKVGTVYCAFASNNILLIVRGIRARYPLARIYTATDNDLDGVKSAEAAKEQYDSVIIPPPQLFKGSDWADLAAEIGIEAVIEELKLYAVADEIKSPIMLEAAS